MLHDDQAGEILSVAALYDERDVTDPAMHAWALTLTAAKIELDDAIAAVMAYYGEPESTERRIMPADVIRIARGLAAERNRERWEREYRERHAPYPGGITYDDVRSGRAELPEGYPPPPDDTRRDRSAELAELIKTGFPDMPTDDDEPGPRKPLSQDHDRLREVWESARIAPDGHERWPLAGDPGMRRRQARWLPGLAAAREASSRQRALEILAGSRRNGDSAYARHTTAEPPSQESDEDPE